MFNVKFCLVRLTLLVPSFTTAAHKVPSRGAWSPRGTHRPVGSPENGSGGRELLRRGVARCQRFLPAFFVREQQRRCHGCKPWSKALYQRVRIANAMFIVQHVQLMSM